MKSFIFKLILFLFFTLSSLYSKAIRIMPLGDSITHGYPSGYRNYLWYELQDVNYAVDFVGSQNDGYFVTPYFDSNHEGYGGWMTYDIAEIVYGLLEDNQPDIILLHIGSNDVSPTQGLNSSSIAGLEYILNQIDYYEQNYNHQITVVLASIINRREYHQTVTDFNINLRNMANSRIAHGDLITLVNMESDAGLTSSDYEDATHPNDSGYTKMANVWFNTLEDILVSESHPRMMEDVNGDGIADVVGFGTKGVSIALSNGSNFSGASLWLEDFGYNQGWKNDETLRKMADIDGDGYADVVGFGSKGVSVALSNGTGFDKASLWLGDFGYDQGWRNDKSLRIMADVNGDGMADIAAFGNKGISVALSTGSDFGQASLWVNDFGYNQGWRNDTSLRIMADVNGDGKADIVGFGNAGVSVALSNGTSFVNAQRWVDDFGYNQGWRNDKGLRFMSDVNGDGKADIVGFGNNGVSVALSNGNSFVNAQRWVDDFGYNQGWTNDKGLRIMSDIDGDGKDDIVGFGNNGVSVAYSNGNSFTGTSRKIDDFGYNQGWENYKHLRLMADVDGDGAADVVGFGNNGVKVSTSIGQDFDDPSSWLNDFGYDQGWKVDFSPYQEQQ